LALFRRGQQVVEFTGADLPAMVHWLEDPRVLIGFNNARFDNVLLKRIIQNPAVTTLELCELAQAVIDYKQLEKENPSREQVSQLTYKIAAPWVTIDLATHLAKGELDSFAGLKTYAQRLRWDDIEDLPYQPGCPLGSDEKKRHVRDYCRKDLGITETLLGRCLPLIELRARLEMDYGIDLMASSEARIAEQVMLKLYCDATGRDPRDVRRLEKPQYPDGIAVADLLPPDRFTTDGMRAFRARLAAMTVTASGKLREGDKEIASVSLEHGGRKYAVALGGLHSSDKREVYRTEPGIRLLDFDVASYYPSILGNAELHPAHLGPEWTASLAGLIAKRLAAKRTGDKRTSDSLKIVINATFGKTGDRYSWMYDPRVKFAVTIGGQMHLLRLIEAMTLAGGEVISANTDGLTLRVADAVEQAVQDAADAWQQSTCFALERTEYRCYARRDVNSYVAIGVDGKVKTKGAFSDNWQDLGRKHDAHIVAKAVIAWYRDGTLVEDTIRNCDNLHEFARTYRRSHLRAKVTWRGAEMQKNVRWYVSTNGSPIEAHAPDGRKAVLADGGMAMVCNRIASTAVPTDLDREHYIACARKIIEPPRPKPKSRGCSGGLPIRRPPLSERHAVDREIQ
jgi:hypothetical protein